MSRPQFQVVGESEAPHEQYEREGRVVPEWYRLALIGLEREWEAEQEQPLRPESSTGGTRVTITPEELAQLKALYEAACDDSYHEDPDWCGTDDRMYQEAAKALPRLIAALEASQEHRRHCLGEL